MMGRRVQVAGPLWNMWQVAALALGALAAWVAEYQYRKGYDWEGLAVAALAAAAFVAVRTAWVLARRTWVTHTWDGFVLQTLRRKFLVTDAAVADFATRVAPVRFNGFAYCLGRTGSLTLRAGAAEWRVGIHYRFPSAGPDPLMGLWQQIEAMLARRAVGEVAAGGELRGRGWTLTGGELEVGTRSAHLAAVTDWAVAAGRVKVWVRGETAAFVNVPLDSRGAVVLSHVLAARPVAPDAPTHPLGRLIAERDEGFRRSACAVLFAVGIAVLGVCAYFFNEYAGWDPAERQGRGGQVAGAALAAIAGAFCLLLAYSQSRRALLCYERGIAAKFPLTTAELAYDDCAALTWSGVRTYSNFLYFGTRIALRVDPRPGAGRAVKFATTVMGDTAELDRIRDTIAAALARPMAAALLRGESVPWVPGIVFRPDGLEVFPDGWVVRSKQGRLVPYRSVTDYRLNAGKFRVYIPGSASEYAGCDSAAKNFFPGLALLVALVTGEFDPAVVDLRPAP